MNFECLDRDLRDLHVMRNIFRNLRYASRELFSRPLEMPDAQFYQNYRMTKAFFLTVDVRERSSGSDSSRHSLESNYCRTHSEAFYLKGLTVGLPGVIYR